MPHAGQLPISMPPMGLHGETGLVVVATWRMWLQQLTKTVSCGMVGHGFVLSCEHTAPAARLRMPNPCLHSQAMGVIGWCFR